MCLPMHQKEDMIGIPPDELAGKLKVLGLKPFATGQILQWIYKKYISSFDEMTNISKDARELLKKDFTLGEMKLVGMQESNDGTKKFAWELEDGRVIESVLIPSESHEKASRYAQQKVPREKWRKRLTLCISTQVGCAMGCSFCRTGDMGFVRNLSRGEIIGQILETAKRTENRITNVVLMGMGEPLDNYENVVGAIRVMLDTKCLGLSRRHVTLSTCGLVPGIERLAKDDPGAKLAVSLNGTTDEQRQRTMPINIKYPMAKLFEALERYSKATGGNVITFEYVMIGGLNDSMDDAKRLVKLLNRFPSKVNLIPLNTCASARPKGRGHNAPSEETVQRFAQFLRNKHIQVNIRSSRGQDIMAACGQLASGT